MISTTRNEVSEYVKPCQNPPPHPRSLRATVGWRSNRRGALYHLVLRRPPNFLSRYLICPQVHTVLTRVRRRATAQFLRVLCLLRQSALEAVCGFGL
ncbi:hypothetical protein DPEC_G00327110 [Dallia pectoralis]|uniref:Uncharacterized protein n=1 Tax=Dallia pectoralis TaxID=75939 RepID=A0ACC2F875_DALPE|nr:hypothetical protein DPEC_G00327110 [Dallia pectoralis]